MLVHLGRALAVASPEQAGRIAALIGELAAEEREQENQRAGVAVLPAARRRTR